MAEPADSPLDTKIADSLLKSLSAYEAAKLVVESRATDRATDAAAIAERDAEIERLNQRLADVTAERLAALDKLVETNEGTRALLQGSLDGN